MTATTPCTHAVSAVLIVDSADRVLLIERNTAPYGYAPPAGHAFEHGHPIDIGYTSAFINSAVEEVREETGLSVNPHRLNLVLDRHANNRCRRRVETDKTPGHLWRVFETNQFDGELLTEPTRETAALRWVGPQGLEALAAITIALTKAEITPQEFDRHPGLEPVWLWWLSVLGRLPNIADTDALHGLLWAERARRDHRNTDTNGAGGEPR